MQNTFLSYSQPHSLKVQSSCKHVSIAGDNIFDGDSVVTFPVLFVVFFTASVIDDEVEVKLSDTVLLAKAVLGGEVLAEVEVEDGESSLNTHCGILLTYTGKPKNLVRPS